MIRKTARSALALRLNDPNMPVLDINDRFVDACANGDYQTVNRILEAIKDFNIDVTDNLGRTALRLAVANEHIEVVQSLLSKSDSQKLREALLLAIFMGHTPIAECILRHPQYKIFNDKKFLNGATDSFWQTPSSDDAQFSPDITPIMLASQYNRTEIVQMLLLNGDRIEKPHDFHCKCNECSNRFKFDSLRHAQSRLNAYRGLASESYISLASIDPILTAFEMGHELRILSEKEKYFKHEYLELAKMLSEYTVKLLSNVRGRDELEIVLNKVGKESEEKYERLARLDFALKYQEMPFVAHPNCQQKIVEIWYTGIRKVTKMNPFLVVLLFVGFIFFIPFGSLIYIVAPNSKLGKFMCLPFIKFFCFSISYVAFIGMIVAASLQFPEDQRHCERFSDVYPHYKENFSRYAENKHLQYRFPTTDFYIRNYTPYNIDIVICVWVLGFILDEIKKVATYGIKDYLLSWKNILTSLMIILFVASYGLKYYTLIFVKAEMDNLDDPEFWAKLDSLEETDIAGQEYFYTIFYWLNADRFYWYSLDPINLSEGLFAVATILCFCKLAFWLPANQSLGPLQITLGRMISDILKFICIFIIIFTGFVFGLHNLYWYYPLDVRSAVEVTRHVNHANHESPYKAKGGEQFGTIGSTVTTMFFALYALGDNDDFKIDPFENMLTPDVGFLLFGMFHISNITILFSMLIAMMTKSFESILSHSDTEWKFSRSRFYLEFIKDGATLPVPFNLIPTPAIIIAFVRKIFCKKCFPEVSRPENEFSPASMSRANGNANGALPGQKTERRQSIGGNVLTYKKVMERVAKRFLLHNNRENEDVKESDFDELKVDVQTLRFEMLTDVRKARESMVRYISILHKGVTILGETFYKRSSAESDLAKNYRSFKSKEHNLRTELEDFYASTALNRPIPLNTQISSNAN